MIRIGEIDDKEKMCNCCRSYENVKGIYFCRSKQNISHCVALCDKCMKELKQEIDKEDK